MTIFVRQGKRGRRSLDAVRVALLSLCVLAMFSPSALAAGARLDPDFGSGGRALVPLSEAADELGPRVGTAVDSEGRIVTVSPAGDRDERFLVVRYLPSGSLDPTFGGDGSVVSTFLGIPTDIAIDSQGRVVVSGNTGTEGNGGAKVSVAARFLPDGSPDSSFASVGVLHTRAPVQAFGVAVDASDRILLAGTPGNGEGATSAVVRYDSDGSQDTTFQPGIESNAISLEDVLLDPAERIVTVGSKRVEPSTRVPLARRYLPDGELDRRFGDDGEQLLPGGRFETNPGGRPIVALSGNGVALDAGGRILVSVTTQGSEVNSASEGFAAARLLPDGGLDRRFDDDGRVVYRMTKRGSIESSVPLGIVADGKGRPILGGRIRIGGLKKKGSFGLLRLRQDGSPDPSFAPHGRLKIGFGEFSVYGGAPLHYPDGRLVLAGQGHRGDAQYGALARVRFR